MNIELNITSHLTMLIKFPKKAENARINIPCITLNFQRKKIQKKVYLSNSPTVIQRGKVSPNNFHVPQFYSKYAVICHLCANPASSKNYFWS